MLSTGRLATSNAASAVPPCLILVTGVSAKFGGLKERFHMQRIYLHVLKTAERERVEDREFLRAKEWITSVPASRDAPCHETDL